MSTAQVRKTKKDDEKRRIRGTRTLKIECLLKREEEDYGIGVLGYLYGRPTLGGRAVALDEVRWAEL